MVMEASLESDPFSTRHTYSPESAEETWGSRSREPCTWAGWGQRYVRMGRGLWSPLSHPMPEAGEGGKEGLAPARKVPGLCGASLGTGAPRDPCLRLRELIPGCGEADCPLACTI